MDLKKANVVVESRASFNGLDCLTGTWDYGMPTFSRKDDLDWTTSNGLSPSPRNASTVSSSSSSLSTASFCLEPFLSTGKSPTNPSRPLYVSEIFHLSSENYSIINCMPESLKICLLIYLIYIEAYIVLIWNSSALVFVAVMPIVFEVEKATKVRRALRANGAKHNLVDHFQKQSRVVALRQRFSNWQLVLCIPIFIATTHELFVIDFTESRAL